ncbi:MAG: peptide ABC transporter substrate-binding protein [Lachnospiraceae bacterium]|nr:peptide ABC transporter substrate-binding protein [Lachnospiraceae bacterium]
MKKRLISVMLVGAMTLSLAACGSSTSSTESSEAATEAAEETTEAATEATTEVAEGETEAAEGETTDVAAIEAADEGFVVNTCIASEPETIDPALISSVDASMYTQHQFEGLMKYQMTDEAVDESGQIMGSEVVCGQAASYEISEDQLVYTFTLRDDIYWSDGEPVTANDFVYAWQRVVDPATASEYGYILDDIVLNASAIQAGEKEASELGIVAVDDKTVQITLESPCAYFLSLCGFASLMPLRQDVVEGSDDWTDPANIVTNGPFIVTEWVHDSYIYMEPNEKYYDVANLGPDGIRWWLSDSETAILSAYQSGEYDFIESFPTDMIETLQESGDCYIDPYIGTYYLYINCDVVTDWRVRAAMTLAIDRENIVENVTQGGQVPATGLVAAGITDSTGADFSEGVSDLGALYNTLQTAYPDYDLETYSGRCELAQALYQEAVDDGSWNPDTTVVYNFNTSDTHKAIAEACGSDWETVLGMSITLENQEWATYTTGLGEHTFGVARLGWIADYDDALTYLELFKTDNPYNYGLYTDSNYDDLLTQAKTLVAGEERDALLYSAEESLFGEGGFPVAPIYYYTQVCCISDDVTNVYFTPMGYYFFAYATANN